MKQLYFFVLIYVLVISCKNANDTTSTLDTETEYTTLLKMQRLEEGITICRILNPWKPEETIAQYLLVSENNSDFNENKKKNYKQKYGNFEVLTTPLKRITLTSSCHAYLLYQLDAIDNVVVMCEANYTINNTIKSIIDKGMIVDGGNSKSPNMEVILANGSDSFWVSPFENSNYNISIPIPVICCADYMEYSPLARAEWMKFYGALLDKKEKADSLFSIVKANYVVKEPTNRHTLLAELPYQSVWYVPGGCSTMGILYQDAGYDYPWANDNHSGSLALSQESVLLKAQNADLWLFKYYADHDYTLKEFLNLNPFFNQFKASKEGNIYGCNTFFSDFYDVTPFRPDILLEELKELKQKYFKRLE